MKIGFSIHGDFITNHVRERWADGDFSGAIKVLTEGLHDFTLEMAIEVISGKKKLEGVNDLTLEDDNWEPDEGDNYPSIHEILEKAGGHDEVELANYRRSEAESIAEAYIASYNDYDQDGEDAKLRRDLVRSGERLVGPDEFQEMIAVRQGLDGISDRVLYQISGGLNSDELLERVMDRGASVKPVKEPDMNKKCGWLLPNGDYYACGWMEHSGLAYNILEEKGVEFDNAEEKAEDLGWVKVTGRSDYTFMATKKPKKKQLDKLWDYCEIHKFDYEKAVEVFELLK